MLMEKKEIIEKLTKLDQLLAGIDSILINSIENEVTSLTRNLIVQISCIEGEIEDVKKSLINLNYSKNREAV